MNEEQFDSAEQNAQASQPPCDQHKPCGDLAVCFRQYAREKPEVAALWCLGIGFVLGWKLKPW